MANARGAHTRASPLQVTPLSTRRYRAPSPHASRNGVSRAPWSRAGLREGVAGGAAGVCAPGSRRLHRGDQTHRIAATSQEQAAGRKQAREARAKCEGSACVPASRACRFSFDAVRHNPQELSNSSPVPRADLAQPLPTFQRTSSSVACRFCLYSLTQAPADNLAASTGAVRRQVPLATANRNSSQTCSSITQYEKIAIDDTRRHKPHVQTRRSVFASSVVIWPRQRRARRLWALKSFGDRRIATLEPLGGLPGQLGARDSGSSAGASAKRHSCTRITLHEPWKPSTCTASPEVVQL